MNYLLDLKVRNEALFVFGLINFSLAIVFFLLSLFSETKVMGVNNWYKPIKFALSIGIYSWTMAWYVHYLESGSYINVYNIVVIISLGFEIFYIAIQAARGQLSHFNQSSALYSSLYFLMAAAASIATIATAYIGYQFFVQKIPQLPDYYLWAIRIGIILFVLFAFEGFVMGSNLSHTIGGPDGDSGLPFLNWSYKYGDPRIAHFIGMHALQIIPLVSFHLLKDTKLTLFLSIIYLFLAIYVFIYSLQGKSFLRFLQ